MADRVEKNRTDGRAANRAGCASPESESLGAAGDRGRESGRHRDDAKNGIKEKNRKLPFDGAACAPGSWRRLDNERVR
jgi:hypothetical protein